ncbi:MAG TPA: C39 family peptidase [Syntrophales bacterium]|nr:C39 family peptidase [Syntrophales bacterium]
MKTTHNLYGLVCFTIVLAIAALLVPSHASEMYKWVDSEGVVHFSDDRPADVNNAKKLKAEDPVTNTDASKENNNSSPRRKAAKDESAGSSETVHKIKNFPLMQQDPSWCALTSIAMIAQYYGYHIDPMQVSVESGVPIEQGMTLEAILKYFDTLKALKLDVEHHYKGDLEEVKKYIDNNIPVLWLHAAGSGPGWSRHAAVVIGYDDTARRMIIADPAYGAEVSYPYVDFLARWRISSELIIAVTSRI